MNTFGIRLRAKMLGYRALHDLGYVRVSAEYYPWRIDVCPTNAAPKAVPGGFHEWWDDREVVEQLYNALALTLTKPLKEAVTLKFDDLLRPVN